MWGAIIGDLAGSIYEYSQTKQFSKLTPKELISEKSFYSDDTILTVAILDAVLNNRNYEYYLKKYAQEYMTHKPNIQPYFKEIFSPGFITWVNSNQKGFSTGNGAMMRISAVGYLFNTKKDVMDNARLATIPSHNSEESIECATIIALIIFFARLGYSKDQIKNELNLNFKYSDFNGFNVTCYKTIQNCLYALFTSNSFEESILKVISFGGDTDTNACIVGSMAEALYGINESLINQVKEKIPVEFENILNKGYQKVKKLH